ncbi:DUF6011 domain-containing protein [Streptomyces sp. NPDC094048]|uniref:DUF6011 domain-containing protein n=1 Tax=unclassified Streptomyces TaxID=2593676 RepID=UPI00332B2E6C
MDGVARHMTDTCGVCHRPLTDDASRAAGIGPICAAKFHASHGTADTHQLTFEETRMPDTTDRNRFAALLAHHADVIAARWHFAAPGPGAWEVAASLALTSHANELTDDEETPAVRELLDSIMAFEAEHPAEPPARQALGTTDQQPGAVTRRVSLEYFIQSRPSGGTWEGGGVPVPDRDDVAARLEQRRAMQPSWEHRIAQRTTTITVAPAP